MHDKDFTIISELVTHMRRTLIFLMFEVRSIVQTLEAGKALHCTELKVDLRFLARRHACNRETTGTLLGRVNA